MSSIKYIVANYLKVLGIEQTTINEMLAFLFRHSQYPTLRSVVESFEEWQFSCTAAEATLEQLKSLGNFFMSFVNSFGGSFILVIATQEYQIIYLNAVGEVVCETYDKFIDKWNHIVFIAEVGENSGRKKSFATDLHSGRPSLNEIRAVSFNQDEPPTYKFFRRFSIYFSYMFARLGVTPNYISSMWVLSMLTASIVISIDTQVSHRILAAVLVIAHFIFDCADGEVSRITQRTSHAGANLEQTFHWISNLSMIVGATVAEFRETSNYHTLYLGLFCLASDCSFHFLYIQFNYWLDESKDYGWLHRLTSLIYPIMPININLFLLACIFNRFTLFLTIWGGLSFLFFILLAFVYFGKELSTRND
ncbi:CDP-alcohol phosphatidyltransferase family protein [Puia dinghuensis]|uniref:CDP-alcohol phosphatidyltransferase family protein n=1 Tax=Puia dinghuensis TaxID=1792502 RepID=UPI00166DAC8D|nr:CDP-alcohol phosphatidyltransferase family protein [Puia dinghuensis]